MMHEKRKNLSAKTAKRNAHNTTQKEKYDESYSRRNTTQKRREGLTY